MRLMDSHLPPRMLVSFFPEEVLGPLVIFCHCDALEISLSRQMDREVLSRDQGNFRARRMGPSIRNEVRYENKCLMSITCAWNRLRC